MKKKRNFKKKTTFDGITFIFEVEINALRKTLPLLETAISNIADKQIKDLGIFVQKQKSKNKESNYDQNANSFQERTKLLTNAMSTIIAKQLLDQSYLIMLVTQFESFLGRLLIAMYYAKPELLKINNKSIDYSELLNFKSLDEAKEYVIMKEKEDMMRKGTIETIMSIEEELT